LYGTLDEAVAQATIMADLRGSSFCVVSGRKKGVPVFRIYPLKGFGLPPGGTLDRVVEPRTERLEIEPQEKNSSNGF